MTADSVLAWVTLFLATVCGGGCAPAVPQPPAQPVGPIARPLQVERSALKLAEKELLCLEAHEWPDASGRTCTIALRSKRNTNELWSRWSATLAEFPAELLRTTPYRSSIVVGETDVALYAVWSDTSFLIARADGRIKQRSPGRALLAAVPGSPFDLDVRFIEPQSLGF